MKAWVKRSGRLDLENFERRTYAGKAVLTVS